MAKKVAVMFVQAKETFGADAAVHVDIIRNLDRDKFEVHVACVADEDQRVPEALAIFGTLPDITLRMTRFAPSLGQRDPKALLRMLRESAEFSSDLLALRQYALHHDIRIVHSADRPRDSVYNVVLAKATRARSVVHVHVKWSEQYSAPAKWAVRRADAVLGISQYVTNTVMAMGKPATEIHTVLNGIETAKWDPDTDGQGVRRELGIPPNALVLASVSRLFSWKGQRELIAAFALVAKQIENVALLIVGADAREVEAQPFSAELKTLACSLGIAEKVFFTGQRSDVPQIMAASDLFTMPSFEEPFGLVFLEAMAMRKPVVALNNGGTPEVVEHGLSGLLSAPYDVPALASNILTLLGDSELRQRMGEYGRRRVLDHFSARRMAQDVGLAYEKILRE